MTTTLPRMVGSDIRLSYALATVEHQLRKHGTEVDRRHLKNQPSKPNNSPRHPNFAIGSADNVSRVATPSLRDPASAQTSGAVTDALADPGVRRRLADLGQELPDRAQQSPESLGALQKAEIEKWWPFIKTVNIKGEYAAGR